MPASFQVHISSRPADHRSNTITVEDDASSWNVGDDIVIASTDFDFEQAERFKIVSVSGRDIAISGDLSTFVTHEVIASQFPIIVLENIFRLCSFWRGLQGSRHACRGWHADKEH